MKSTRQIRARWYAAAGTVLAALALAAPQGAAAAGAATSGRAGGTGPHWSGNLIADGDAGAGYCTRDWNAATTIPGWVIRTGSPNVMCYSTARVGHPAGAAGPAPVLPAVRLAGRVEDRARARAGVPRLPRPLGPAGRHAGHAAHGVP